MLRKPLFWETFVLMFVVGTINFVANTYNLYWSVSELDSLVHFLAGAVVATFFLWLYFFSGAFRPQKKGLAQFFLISILGMLFIAVSWEIYELILGEAEFAKEEYPFDTTLDFIMDFLGALVACLYGYIKEISTLGAKDHE